MPAPFDDVLEQQDHEWGDLVPLMLDRPHGMMPDATEEPPMPFNWIPFWELICDRGYVQVRWYKAGNGPTAVGKYALRFVETRDGGAPIVRNTVVDAPVARNPGRHIDGSVEVQILAAIKAAGWTEMPLK